MLENELIFQWWAVDESRMNVFEYYSAASKYTPVFFSFGFVEIMPVREGPSVK